MERPAQDLSPELYERQINMQINAVTRAMELLGEDSTFAIDDVIGLLAFAETKAQFLCGFVDLHNSDEVKKQLNEEIVARGFVTVEDGKAALTEAGKQRSTTPLPTQIEEALR